jgi:hypothetical protein
MSCVARTLPHFLPQLRSWRPVRIKVVVDGSSRPFEKVHLKLSGVKAVFSSPFGSNSLLVTCTPTILDNRGQVFLAHQATVTIWPKEAGAFTLSIISLDRQFEQREISSHVEALSSTVSHTLAEGNDTRSKRLVNVLRFPLRWLKWVWPRRPVKFQGGNPDTPSGFVFLEYSWVFLVKRLALVLAAVCLVGGAGTLVWHVVAAKDADLDISVMEDDQTVKHSEQTPTQAESQVGLTNAPKTGTVAPITNDVTVQVSTQVTETMSAPSLQPTGCAFQNSNRPKVDEKFILTCIEDTFLGTAKYDFERYTFVFRDFEPYTP